MKYSQPARAASSRRDFSLSDTAIQLCRSVGPKIYHSPEDAISPRPREDGFAVARLVVTASDKSPHGHAGGLAGRHAADAVLDHQRAARICPHFFGRVKKQIGRGLAAFHHLRRVEPAVEMRRKTGQCERKGYAIDVAG